MSNPPDETRHLDMFERMLLIRRFEEALVGLAEEKAFTSHYHLYIGQEATGAAVMEVLGADDRIATTHRNHGHLLARGADPKRAMAEILCRATGLNGGRGGTLHMCAPALGFLSTSAVVGGCIGLALGASYALQRAGKGNIAVAFFGDGSLEEGVSSEAMNIAALWSLPLLLICENNSGGALGSAGGEYPSSTIAAKELTAIPAALGIETRVVDGASLGQVLATAGEAARHCRAGRGPFFIEARTERWPGSRPIWPRLLTGVTEVAMAWNGNPINGEYGAYGEWYGRNDPVLRLARELLADGRTDPDGLSDMDKRVAQRIDQARTFALESPLPDDASALTGAFA